MSKPIEPTDDEVTRIANALHACASEIEPRPDLDGVRAQIASRPTAGSSPSAARNDRRLNVPWLAVAAALVVIAGTVAALVLGRGNGADQGAVDVAGGNGVHPIHIPKPSGPSPASIVATYDRTWATTSRSADWDRAALGTLRIVGVNMGTEGRWWVVGLSTVGLEAKGDWNRVRGDDASRGWRRQLDGWQLILTPQRGNDADALDPALSGWADGIARTATVDSTWPMPRTWKGTDGAAFRTWLDPSGGVAANASELRSMTVRSDPPGAFNDAVAEVLAVPETADRSELPRWLSLAAGRADPVDRGFVAGYRVWETAPNHFETIIDGEAIRALGVVVRTEWPAQDAEASANDVTNFGPRISARDTSEGLLVADDPPDAADQVLSDTAVISQTDLGDGWTEATPALSARVSATALDDVDLLVPVEGCVASAASSAEFASAVTARTVAPRLSRTGEDARLRSESLVFASFPVTSTWTSKLASPGVDECLRRELESQARQAVPGIQLSAPAPADQSDLSQRSGGVTFAVEQRGVGVGTVTVGIETFGRIMWFWVLTEGPTLQAAGRSAALSEVIATRQPTLAALDT